MSSLTEEQRRRIEENKIRALEKLAHRKSQIDTSSSTQQKSNASFTSHPKNQPSNNVSSNTAAHCPDPVRNAATADNKNLSSTSAQQSKIWNTLGSNQNSNLKKANLETKPNSSINPISADDDKKGHDKVTQPANSFYGKKTVIKAKTILLSRTHFMVEVGFHAGLIALFKTMETREYSKF